MKISFRTKLIISFLAVVIVTGFVGTLVVVNLIGDGIIKEKQDKVRTDLNSAREIYQEELKEIRDLVRLTAVRFFIKDALLKSDLEGIEKELYLTNEKYPTFHSKSTPLFIKKLINFNPFFLLSFFIYINNLIISYT